MNKVIETKSSERGSAGAKLLLVIIVLALIGNAGYQFIPIAKPPNAYPVLRFRRYRQSE